MMRSLEFQRVDDTVTPVVTTTGRVLRATGSDVLVRVTASSINGTDTGLRHATGLLGLVMSRSRPGFDVAGEIVGCGEKVTAFEVGDHVMGLLDHSGGGQADYVIVAQHRLARIPPTLSHTDAAAIPLAGLTALQALRGRGRLQAGGAAKVLINGAAGGIGSFAVQLAKIFGAHVTAVTSGQRHDYLDSLGADRTLDRHDAAIFSGSHSFDLIFDTPGALRFTDVQGAMRPDGVLVSTRPITADTPRMLRPPWRSARAPRFAAVATSASSQDLAFLAQLVEEERLAVPVDRVVPLADAAEAYDHAESGEIRGKVVLTL